MSKGRVLITGWSGTGKSTLFRELESRGLHALDADDRTLGLCSWVEISSNKDFGREFPADYSAQKYDWRWKESVLQDLLKSDEVFLCGNANNAFDFYHLFDKIFILNIPEHEQRRRMMSRTEHDYGHDLVVQDMVIERQATLLIEAVSRGAIEVDASSSPDEIADKILGFHS